MLQVYVHNVVNKMQLKILFTLFVISFSIFSQTQGVVVDVNGKPIDNVRVYIVDHDVITYTDQMGQFIFSTPTPLNSFFEFSKVGYETLLYHYLGGNISATLNALHVELDEVGIVEANKILGNNKTMSIESKFIENNFTSSSSLVESIAKLPGINTIGSGLGIQKIVIRGLSGMRVVTYLNGMKIENQQWANDHSIGFSALGLSDVELIKGASSLIYGGEAVGGLVYFKDSPFIESQKLSGFLATKFDNSHLLFGNQFGLRWSKNNFFINIYGQYDLASDYRLPNNKYLFNSRFRNQAFKFSLAKRTKNSQNIFRYQNNIDEVGIPAHVHGDLSNVVIDNISSNQLILPEDFEATRPTQFINNHLFTLENIFFVNNIKYTLFLGHFINHMQEYEKWTTPGFDMTMSNSIFRTNIKKFINDVTINVGSSFTYLENTNNITDFLIPNANSRDMGIYSVLDYNKKSFGANIGLRFDYKTLESAVMDFKNSFSSISSSYGLFVKKKDHLLRLTYSSSFRSPHFSELFSNGLHHGTMRYEIGNVNLKNEISHQFDVKHQWSSKHIGLVINPFFQYINDFISINPRNEFYNNRYRIYDYDQFSEIILYGAEANIHFHPHFLHNLHLEQSYSFLKARNLDQNTFLALTPANKIKSSINFSTKEYNVLTLNMISLYHLYVFNQDNVAQFESKSEAYSVVNFEISFNPLKNSTLVFGVNNLLNKEYVPHLSRIKEVGPGVPNPGRSFNMSLKYDF